MPGCRVDISLLSHWYKKQGCVFFILSYSVVAAIPEGCVVTYGQIASLVGRPQCSRMVGQAMHNVPEELHLPCHRVVNSRGRLVPGWTEQRVLLENEGVRFKKEQ